MAELENVSLTLEDKKKKRHEYTKDYMKKRYNNDDEFKAKKIIQYYRNKHKDDKELMNVLKNIQDKTDNCKMQLYNVKLYMFNRNHAYLLT